MILIGSAVLVGTISFYLVVFSTMFSYEKPRLFGGVVFYYELIFLSLQQNTTSLLKGNNILTAGIHTVI